MTALAFDFDFGPADGVVAAPAARPRLYAVRGTVDAPAARVPATPTLDALLGGAWSALAMGAPAACPVCASALSPRWSAGAGVTGGRCGGCGSSLD